MSDQLVREEPVNLDELRNIAVKGQLYAILDACNAPVVLEKVSTLSDQDAVMLDGATPDEDYPSYAPYVVKVNIDTLHWIKDSLWQEPWGIFVISEAEIGALRSHFEIFLTVEDPDGKELFFRFYDPRVLKTFLLTSTKEELNNFYRMIIAYGVSAQENEHIVSLCLNSI